MIGALYWQDGLSLGKIAARPGCSAGRVGSAMRAAGIPRRDAHDRSVRPGPWWVTRDELTVLYVDRALTAREVAAELGCDPARVTAALRRYRIARLVDPVRLYVERATLTRLYVTERLDDPQIAARYGVPPWRVTRRRRELDVHRPRTRHPDTPTPDLPAAVADEHLADPTGDPALAALHRDPEIAAWLRRHHIPRHPATPAGGVAGPGPAELTRPLLQRAYQHIGLSAPQIGSLTGRATPQVIPRPAHPRHPRPRRRCHLPLAAPPQRVPPGQPAPVDPAVAPIELGRSDRGPLPGAGTADVTRRDASTARRGRGTARS